MAAVLALATATVHSAGPPREEAHDIPGDLTQVCAFSDPRYELAVRVGRREIYTFTKVLIRRGDRGFSTGWSVRGGDGLPLPLRAPLRVLRQGLREDGSRYYLEEIKAYAPQEDYRGPVVVETRFLESDAGTSYKLLPVAGVCRFHWPYPESA